MEIFKYKIDDRDFIDYKKKSIARKLVSRHVKSGHLLRSSVCELCKNQAITEAHHTDYGRPLDVMWLCDACHGLCHRDDSVYNPKNIRQTPLPMAWEQGESVTVSFTLPARNFLAMKKLSERDDICMSKMLRECVMNAYVVENNQLKFNFEENNGRLVANL